MPCWDYSKLKGKTKEMGFTQKEVAECADMSETTYSLKLNGKYPFKQDEIQRIIAFLSISQDEIGAYFFTLKV